MSLPRYPEYKDSGVEWLGEVPESWVVTRLKRTVSPDRAITYGIVQAGPHVPDGVAYIRPADMSDEDGVRSPEEVMRTSPEIAEAYGRSTIRTGDLVCSIGPSFGKAMITPAWLDGANLTQGTARIAVAAPNSPRFVFWFVRSAIAVAQWESSIGGATFRALNLGPLAETCLALPPCAEQEAIVEFLDRETAKIDALVAEQQRLIELLKEKRQAVISHAVTKGLNPNAPMKDSGIEWLGEVPAHWQVVKMKWVAKMESGHTPDKKVPAYWDYGDIPWISLNDTGYLKDHDYISETAYAVTHLGIENSSAHLLPPKAVVFSRDATIGRCAITTRSMAVSQHFIGWICSECLVPEFLLLRLRSMTAELERLTTGATLKTIGMPEVRTLVTPVPPVPEQQAIIDWVGRATAQVDGLISEATRAIDLLQERRTALISAAVTGQIDVRPRAQKA